MIKLVLPTTHAERFWPQLTYADRENCVILFTQAVSSRGQLTRLLASDFLIPPADAYTRHGPLEAQLSPDFVARISKRALRQGSGLVFAHSHPGDSRPHFSTVDDEGEAHLSTFLRRRGSHATHVALVTSAGGTTARVLGSREMVEVIEVGRHRKVLSFGSGDRHTPGEQHDRQVRAFGAGGQHQISQLSVGIVGLGGTGSIVAQQLAHLGVKSFLLIDADAVDATNLNRLANAAVEDVGREKTEVARRYIQEVAPSADVECVTGDVMKAKVAKRLADVDLFFGCTDSHGSRAVLQQISYQYLVPCFDMGTTIVSSRGRVSHIHGRVQMLSPGLPCLTCSQLLDPSEVRRDMLSAYERQLDPYIVGVREPAPAVMSLNGTVASLSVTMFLASVTSIPSEARHVLYNAINSTLRIIAPRQQPDCFICSPSGTLARGDSAPLMARLD